MTKRTDRKQKQRKRIKKQKQRKRRKKKEGIEDIGQEVGEDLGKAGQKLGGALGDPLGTEEKDDKTKKSDDGGRTPSPPPVKAAPKAPKIDVIATAPAPGPGPAPATGSGSAPAPAGGAPAGAPGAPAGAFRSPGGWSSWYFKKDNETVRTNLKYRMHMDASKGLPAHGYWGKLVEHDDMETGLGDWQHEMGEDGYDDEWKKVCAKHPNSPWCKKKTVWSGSRRCTNVAGMSTFLVMIATGLF